MTEIFFQGFLLQASLILALGAQNIFVLNSGLQKQKHLLVALISSICDTILVFLGVLGFATLFVQLPILKISLGILGVGFLLFYGIKKLSEAKKEISYFAGNTSSISIKKAVLTSLGFSLLNPHVYLDTVVLVGGFSSKFEAISERIFFGAGASLFSTIWFFGLATLSSFFSHLLSSPSKMRFISLISGLILICLSFKLSLDIYEWLNINIVH